MTAFFSSMAWRAIPSPLSKLHSRLDSLLVTQWTPRHTRRDSRGKRSTLLPLETRPDFPGESGMPPRDPCHPWRGIFGPGHKPRYGLFCPAVTRVGSQLTLETRMKDWTSMGQHRRKSEFPVETRDSRRNASKSTWFTRHPKMRPWPATASQVKSHVPS